MSDLSNIPTEDLIRMLQQHPEITGGAASKAHTGTDAGASDLYIHGLTGGLSDYVGAAGDYIGDKISGALGKLGVPVKEGSGDETFNDALKHVRTGIKEYKDDHPILANAAEITGGITSPVFQGITGLAEKGLARVAPAAPQIAKYFTQGAAAGAFGGAGSAEGDDGGLPSGYNLLKSTAVGSALGGAIGTAVPYAMKGIGRVGAAAADLLQAGMDKLPFNQESAAARKVAQNLGRDNISPADLEANFNLLGPNANVVDAAGSRDPNSGVWLGGKNTYRSADALANMPGKTQDLAERVLKPRPMQAADEVLGAVDSHLHPGDYYGNVNALAQERSVNARPLYQKAFAPTDQSPIKSELIDRLMTRPLFQQGLRKGVSDVADEAAITGEDLAPFQTYFEGQSLDDPNLVIKKAPSLRILDAAKRGLDSILAGGGEDVRNPLTGRLTQRGMRVEQMRSSLVDELDNLTGGEDGAYAQARKAWAGPSAMLDAMQKGRGFMNGDREGVVQTFSKMSPDEQNAFRLGAAREIQGAVEKTGTVPAALKNILNPANKQRQLIQSIFPNADQFLDTVAGVVRKGSATKMIGGSDTFARGANAADIGSDLGGAALELAKGNPGTAATGALRSVYNLLSQPSEGTRDAMGDLLLNPQSRDAAITALRARANANPYMFNLLNAKALGPAIAGYGGVPGVLSGRVMTGRSSPNHEP